MNSLRETTLEQMQRQMRERQPSRRGRPHKPKLPEIGPWGISVSRRLRRRVAVLVHLQHGRSVEEVATSLHCDPALIHKWLEQGAPLVGDFVINGLSLDEV